MRSSWTARQTGQDGRPEPAPGARIRASVGAQLRSSCGTIVGMSNRDDLSYAREFKLSITRALGDQLFEAMDETSIAPLTQENIDALESRPGVYELHSRFDDGWCRVYVGKASRSLPQRLSRHRFKLSGRENVELANMAFKCAYVDEDFDSSAPEKMLIARHQATGDVVWNNNGFGNNDPGRQRDTSLVRVDHFDAQYPVNLDICYSGDDLGIGTASEVYDALDSLKAHLPYNLRFDRKAKEALAGKKISDLPDDGQNLTVRAWLDLLMKYFPDGWQLTVLPGYLILYRESREYLSARRYWRTAGGRVAVSDGAGWTGVDVGP